MGYKFKPNKGVAKRMRLSKTGKLKHRHEKNSHHRSGRSSKLKRHLGRPAILAEGHSRNMRRFLGAVGLRPRQVAHEKGTAATAEKTE
jgi:large subunit ribosomal protein L35